MFVIPDLTVVDDAYSLNKSCDPSVTPHTHKSHITNVDNGVYSSLPIVTDIYLVYKLWLPVLAKDPINITELKDESRKKSYSSRTHPLTKYLFMLITFEL